MRRPSWWSHNGGPLVLLAAVLLAALIAAGLRLWIGPPGPSEDGLLAGLISAEAAVLVLFFRYVPTDGAHKGPNRARWSSARSNCCARSFSPR